MKKTIKAAAALLVLSAAAVLLTQFLRFAGCLVIWFADSCEIPL